MTDFRRSAKKLATAAICVLTSGVGSVALPVTAAHAARASEAAHAARTGEVAHVAGPAGSLAAAGPGAARPVCAGAARSNPVLVTLKGVRSAYAPGGGWSTLRLTLHNRTRAVCAQLDPVLVYGAHGRTLKAGAVRLETRLGGRWRPVALHAALGELVGAVGPTSGIRLLPGASRTLTVRMRLVRAAPHGDWLSLAVAYAPMQHKGTTVAWPVGVTDPAYFRVGPARPVRGSR